MSKKIYEEANIQGIADGIRYANGSSMQYTPAQMGTAVRALKKTLVPKIITENDTYDPSDDDADGYSQVTVNVSSGGGDRNVITGSDEPSTSLGSNGDVYKRVIPIPNNVNFVEYLTSNGTQYIDTNIYGTEATKAIVRFSCAARSNNVFGARESTTSKQLIIAVGTTSSEGALIGFSATRNSYSAFALNTVYEMILERYKKSINNVVEYTTKDPAFTTPGTLILFGANMNGTIQMQSSSIYRVSIFQNGAPVSDFLPCIDPYGVSCMWENVKQEYVYNDGTGDFAYGDIAIPNALDPIYYVKVNGVWEIINR